MGSSCYCNGYYKSDCRVGLVLIIIKEHQKPKQN